MSVAHIRHLLLWYFGSHKAVLSGSSPFVFFFFRFCLFANASLDARIGKAVLRR